MGADEAEVDAIKEHVAGERRGVLAITHAGSAGRATGREDLVPTSRCQHADRVRSSGETAERVLTIAVRHCRLGHRAAELHRPASETVFIWTHDAVQVEIVENKAAKRRVTGRSGSRSGSRSRIWSGSRSRIWSGSRIRSGSRRWSRAVLVGLRARLCTVLTTLLGRISTAAVLTLLIVVATAIVVIAITRNRGEIVTPNVRVSLCHRCTSDERRYRQC